MFNINKIFILLFLVLSFNNILAQLNYSLGTSQSYSDNPFHSPIAESSLISTFDFGVQYKLPSISFGYYGNYSHFNEIGDRNYYWHQIGLWSATDTSIFGLYLEQRLNTLEFEYYNYTNYNTYYKHKFNFSGTNLSLGAILSYTNYSFLDDLDNIYGSIGLTLNRSFETKTTLIGGINYNYKNYISTDLNSADLVGDSLFSSSTSAFTSQFNFYGRIAQSITETTGLALHYSNQNIVGGTANFIRELDYVYGDESQYFDDPISYQGYSLSIQLTQILPEGIKLKIIYTDEFKEYPSQGIYVNSELFDPNILRNDDVSDLNISVSKNFYFGDNQKTAILLTLGYRQLQNKSNSYWYSYSTNLFTLNFDYQF